MAEIVKLNRLRKGRARAEARAQADANAALHGLPKTERALALARRARAEKVLEAHRRDGTDEPDPA